MALPLGSRWPSPSRWSPPSTSRWASRSAEDAGDHAGRKHGASPGRPARRVPGAERPVHDRPDPARKRHREAVRCAARPARGAAHRGGREGDHPPVGQVDDRRLARSRRGGDAVRRLSSARAAGPRGDDADPRSGQRKCVRDGRGGASTLRLLRPHPADRDRRRQPRPRARRGPQQQPRAPLHERRWRCLGRARGEGRPDLPGDKAARRPAGRAPASTQLAGGGLRRVRADGRIARSRTSSRRWSARSRTRQTPARSRCAA